MIRRRSLRHRGKSTPAALKQSEGGDGAVCNAAPLRVRDLRVSAAELDFEDLAAAGMVFGASRRFGEEGEAKGVAAGPGDGDAGNRRGEAVVERVDRQTVSAVVGEWDQSAIADAVRGDARHSIERGPYFRVLGFAGIEVFVKKTQRYCAINSPKKTRSATFHSNSTLRLFGQEAIT